MCDIYHHPEFTKVVKEHGCLIVHQYIWLARDAKEFLCRLLITVWYKQVWCRLLPPKCCCTAAFLMQVSSESQQWEFVTDITVVYEDTHKTRLLLYNSDCSIRKADNDMAVLLGLQCQNTGLYHTYLWLYNEDAVHFTLFLQCFYSSEYGWFENWTRKTEQTNFL